MNINQRFSYLLGILVYKCLNNFAPEYLSSLLTNVSDIQPYLTRAAINNCLALPKPKLSLMKQSFQYFGPSLLNTLSFQLSQSDSLISFKHSLKQFIISN